VRARRAEQDGGSSAFGAAL